MFTEETLAAIQQELTAAASARSQLNSGKMRVCARRAVGIAARAYLNDRHILFTNPSVMNVLGLLLDQPEIPPQSKLRIEKLIQKVDLDHTLPGDIDLLYEAESLIGEIQALI